MYSLFWLRAKLNLYYRQNILEGVLLKQDETKTMNIAVLPREITNFL